MPPSGIPFFFQQLSVFYSRLYFYSSPDMCFAWSVLFDICLCLFYFVFKSSILAGHTYLREPKLYHDLLELLSMLHLNLLWARTCSSASLISFWAWCALVFLKKCSPDSLRFIWELVKFWRNSLLLHLNYFERKKKNYAHDLHLYLFELMKSNTWKLVPKW